jgi:hypothetical protein
VRPVGVDLEVPAIFRIYRSRVARNFGFKRSKRVSDRGPFVGINYRLYETGKSIYYALLLEARR